MNATFQRGDVIEYVATLGAIDSPDASCFSGTVQPGERGTYQGRHPNKTLGKRGWHMTQEVQARSYYVPVRESQIRKAGAS